MKKSNTGKSYVTLCTRASTCAVDLKLYCDFSSFGFQRALKEFIAKTSSATGKWLSTLKKDHNLASYIGALNVNRNKFNIAQASWWGGFFACFILVSWRGLFQTPWPKPPDLSRVWRCLAGLRELHEQPSFSLSWGRVSATSAYPKHLAEGKTKHNLGGRFSGNRWRQSNKTNEILPEKQGASSKEAVSYTHLTLPTSDLV